MTFANPVALLTLLTIPLHLVTPEELDPPIGGAVILQDAETGAVREIPGASALGAYRREPRAFFDRVAGVRGSRGKNIWCRASSSGNPALLRGRPGLFCAGFPSISSCCCRSSSSSVPVSRWPGRN